MNNQFNNSINEAMNSSDRKAHWENIYKSKAIEEFSWYQPTPETSLRILKRFGFDKETKIIDVGGGNSFLVDHLLELGYLNITVLDISESAINNAKARLGDEAEKVQWIVSDIIDFRTEEVYDIWHDRAAFHFLTEARDIDKYVKLASQSIKSGGGLIIGAFSIDGPDKCSGIPVKQYSDLTMASQFADAFIKQNCIYIDHETPSRKVQNFIYCRFVRK